MLELCLETTVDLARSGVRFGQGLFETLRIQKGQPWHLDWHRERLQSGCAFLGLEEAPEADVIEDFLCRHALCSAISYGVLRLLAVDQRLFCWAEPLDLPPANAVEIGISHGITRLAGCALTRFKTLSGLDHFLLRQEAASRGLFEVIALNQVGRLTDGGRFNLFALEKGLLLTPPVKEGVLPGVGRRALLETGLAVEKALEVEELRECEGLFLVNALRGVMAVRAIQGLGPVPEAPAMMVRIQQALT